MQLAIAIHCTVDLATLFLLFIEVIMQLAIALVIVMHYTVDLCYIRTNVARRGPKPFQTVDRQTDGQKGPSWSSSIDVCNASTWVGLIILHSMKIRTTFRIANSKWLGSQCHFS